MIRAQPAVRLLRTMKSSPVIAVTSAAPEQVGHGKMISIAQEKAIRPHLVIAIPLRQATAILRRIVRPHLVRINNA